MQRERVEERIKPILVKLHKAYQDKLRRALSPTFRAGAMVFFIPWRVVAEESGAAHFGFGGSPACFLSGISGWRDGVLYPLAGGGRGIRRGAFWLRRRDAARPARAGAISLKWKSATAVSSRSGSGRRRR